MKIFLCATIFVLSAYCSLFAKLKFDGFLVNDKVDSDTEKYAFCFPFVNDANDVVRITNMETSCSCTIAELEKTSYKPNESGKIDGVFNIGNRTGVQRTEIIVHTDNISQPKIKLSVSLKIQAPVEIKPRLIYWKRLSEVFPKNVVLKIVNDKWRIKSIDYDKSQIVLDKSSESNGCNLRISPISTKENMQNVVKITLANDCGQTKTFPVYVLVK